MKKVTKGSPGYLDYKKKAEIVRAICYFLIIAAVFYLGYSQTHTKKNMMTIVAILGCLPASKVLVSVITRLPYHSVKEEFVQKIQEKTAHLTVIYDLIVTSKDNIMPIDCVVISGDKVYGYTSNNKVDINNAGNHIQTILHENGLNTTKVKIMNQYKPFESRIEGLNNIQAVENEDLNEIETKISLLIQQISL